MCPWIMDAPVSRQTMDVRTDWTNLNHNIFNDIYGHIVLLPNDGAFARL